MKITIENSLGEPSLYVAQLAQIAHDMGVDVSRLEIHLDGNRIHASRTVDGKIDLRRENFGDFALRCEPFTVVATGVAITVGGKIAVSTLEKIGAKLKDKLGTDTTVHVTYGHEDAYR